MKYIYLYVSFTIFLFGSCSSNKIPKTAEDKTLFGVLKKLDKDPSDTELKNTITNLYNEAAKSHLDKIDVYNTLTDADRWTRIVKEYEALKNLSEVIANSAAAKSVNAPTYASEILTAKQNGAEAYYTLGVSGLGLGDKQSARNAYHAFGKSNEFVPGYKDVRQQMSIAYENSILNIIINPLTDNTFFYNSMGWNNYGNNLNNDYFQRSLVNDLGGSYSRIYPAQFYTDVQARNENIQPDWVVDLIWQYINIPEPLTNLDSRTISRQIENGKDTSGRIQYQTVTATLHITRKHFTASGDMELRITDVNTGRNISSNRYSEQFTWQEEYATYSGDSRALGSNDLELVNNNHHENPRKEIILDRLSQKIYPQIKNRIAAAANW